MRNWQGDPKQFHRRVVRLSAVSERAPGRRRAATWKSETLSTISTTAEGGERVVGGSEGASVVTPGHPTSRRPGCPSAPSIPTLVPGSRWGFPRRRPPLWFPRRSRTPWRRLDRALRGLRFLDPNWAASRSRSRPLAILVDVRSGALDDGPRDPPFQPWNRHGFHGSSTRRENLRTACGCFGY